MATTDNANQNLIVTAFWEVNSGEEGAIAALLKDFLPQAQHTDVFEEIFATPLGLDFAQVARLYGLVYSPVTDRSGLEPAITDALGAQTSTMVVVRYKREDSVNGHRVCWEAAAAALRA